MSKFLSTTYRDTVEDITNIYNDLVNNPFYELNDKKPITATYYNVNKDESSVDPGSKLQYDNIGDDTPMRWNRIYNLMMFGFPRIELNTEIGEFGLEANQIEGECYIQPNTIVPYENDYFEVNHIKDSSWLFIVKDVQRDTLDNGSNAYKISFKLEYIDRSKIIKNIVHNFTVLERQEGTNIVSVVRLEDLEIAKILDKEAVKLKKYYIELFYSKKVQTFIYMDLYDIRVYDPFMIEFLIRNKILENGSDHLLLPMHQIKPPHTFSLDYDRTIFRAFEEKDKEVFGYRHQTNIDDIHQYGTTFSAAYEKYFQATWKEHDFHGFRTMCFDEKIMDHIVNHTFYEEPVQNKKNELWKNIFVKHFYDDEITEEEVKAIKQMPMKEAAPVFYLIPLMIYCLECEIERVLK